MKKVNIILDIVVLVLSILFFLNTLNLPQGTGSPGSNPAIYPQVILILLIMFVLIDLITMWIKDNKENFFNKLERENLKKFGIIILLIVVFILLFKIVPFIILAVSIIFIQCLILKLKPVTSIITATTLGISIYYLFVYGLNIIL